MSIKPESGPISPIGSGNITVKDVFDYVMNTPENTNPNVLKSMLNELSGGGFDNSIANALMVEFYIGNDEIVSDTTYDQLNAANQNQIPIIFLIEGNCALARKTNQDSYIGTLITEKGKYIITYSENNIALEEAVPAGPAA